MTKKLISFDDEATGHGLPDEVMNRLTTHLAGNDGADGQDGADGITPHIGENGNWFVGDEDTGVMADRFVFSEDPDHPLSEGQILVVLDPLNTWLESFSGGISDWTPRWVNGNWDHVTGDTYTDGAALQVSGAAGRRMISFNQSDTLTDVEVVARIKQTLPTAGGLGGGVAVRASGGPGTEQGYAAYANEGNLLLTRFVGGAYTELRATPFSPGKDTWYWIRLRAIGSQLQAKAWADGAEEPADWMISTLDGQIPGAGWVGAVAASNPYTQTWDVVGVAADGGTAPTGVA